MSFLNDTQKQTLRAICDAFIPSLASPDGQHDDFWKRKASDLKVAENIELLISQQPEEQKKEFLLLLNLFSSSFFSAYLVGKFAPFHELDAENQQSLLFKMAENRFTKIRKGFNAVKKLACFLFYGYAENSSNPNWEAIGYHGALDLPPNKKRSIQPIEIEGDTVLDCEILVIGSGAGGGVVAGELSEVGKDVIVVEKGLYLDERDFTQLEADMISKLYEAQGALTSEDGTMTVFAGSCLGGGTTINWSGSFKTPSFVLEEWAKEHQVDFFTQKSFQDSLDAVSRKMYVNTEVIRHNRQNELLIEGSKKLNQLVLSIPQNQVIQEEGEEEQWDYRKFGYSGFGCQYGYKKGTLKTYLKEAHERGTRIIANTDIEKITIQHGEAKGAEGFYTDIRTGKRYKITIRAKKVVVAAGAIHTPALLMRSGLQHKQIGQNLYLHPVSPVPALYKHDIHSWWGIAMSATNDAFVNLDGNYGFKIETPPAHPGMIGLVLPWQSGMQHKFLMQQVAKVCTIFALVRDKYAGSISLNKAQRPVINYNIHPYDLNHVLTGMEKITNIHFAAGADRVLFMHNSAPSYNNNRKIAVRDFIRNRKWTSNRYQLFSAHQMGTCRMGGNASTHPLAPSGEMYEVKNLYVADASAFPSSSGANPMLTIMAIAHHVAQGLK